MPHTHMDPSGPAIIGNSAVVIPGAQRIIYVHHNMPNLSDLESAYVQYYATSVNAALTNARSGRGDIIQLLPGHEETISAADGWSNLGTKTGVRIQGPMTGPRATFTWSAAASTVLFDAADTVIDGMRPGGIHFEFAGDPDLTAALTVTAPITVSAARCGIHNVTCQLSIDADQLCTTGITTTVAADDLSITNCHFYGATAGEITTGMQIIGADRLVMHDCIWEGATSAVAVGIIRFATTASTQIDFRGNTFINLKALSTCAVTGLANVGGTSRDDKYHYLDTASLTCWLTSAGIMNFHRPTVSNTAGETGTETAGTVSA